MQSNTGRKLATGQTRGTTTTNNQPELQQIALIKHIHGLELPSKSPDLN